MANPFKDWTPEMVVAHQLRVKGTKSVGIPTHPATGIPVAEQKQVVERTKQTKVEMEYGRMLAYGYPDHEIVPFGITLRLLNGHKYTPDFIVKLPGGKLLCVEVKQRGKNGFRQHSYQRAKVMFDQCRIEYPEWDWQWTEKDKTGWNIKTF